MASVHEASRLQCDFPYLGSVEIQNWWKKTMEGFRYQQSNSSIQPCKVLLNFVWVLCPVSVKTLTLCICCKRIPGMYFSICRSAPLFDIRHGHPIFTKELRGSAMIERQGPTVLPNLLQGKAKCCKDGGRIDELLVWQNTNFHGNAMNLSEGGSGQFILSRSRIDASTISTMVLIVWLLQNNYSTKTSNLFKFAVPSFNTNLSSV